MIKHLKKQNCKKDVNNLQELLMNYRAIKKAISVKDLK